MVPQPKGYGPSAPVPVYQWESEFAVVLELYRRFKPKRVLEIGTYYGGTLYHWLQNAQPGAQVISLDSYAVGVDNREQYPDWVPDGVLLDIVAGDSRDPQVIEYIRERAPYDWIFIDAGHYLHEVTSDWNTYGPMALPGGVVLFHDILPPTQAHPEIEVAALWEAIKRTHRTFEVVADRDAEWGGIGCVLV
jgi:cephalosporin hydroxylase